MNLEETAAVLAKAAGYDNRTVGRSNVLAWHESLSDLSVGDCLAAVAQHHRESDAYLMPVHVRRLAEKLRKERQDREFEEQQRHELEAYATQAGPLRDRTDDIRQLVDQIRSILPDGDVKALHPRREYWRREHRAYERQVNAEPNPHYRHRRTGDCPAAVSGRCVSMTEGYAICEPDECVHHPSGQRAEAAS